QREGPAPHLLADRWDLRDLGDPELDGQPRLLELRQPILGRSRLEEGVPSRGVVAAALVERNGTDSGGTPTLPSARNARASPGFGLWSIVREAGTGRRVCAGPGPVPSRWNDGPAGGRGSDVRRRRHGRGASLLV